MATEHNDGDDTMHQVRELLFGEFKRDSDTRALRLEVRLKEMEDGLLQKITALEERIDALADDVKMKRAKAFEDLAQNMVQLSEHIRQIGRD
jgi:hypothetical protein